ncbi:F-box domain-containing protein [Aphelenchoides avenae]|nr:F-box domain-containing protein [Aphelenchus avenae]
MDGKSAPTLDIRQTKRKCDDEEAKPVIKRPFLESALQITANGEHAQSSASAAINDWLNEFKAMSMNTQLDALNSLVAICLPPHVRHLQKVVEPYFHKDFITLLPKELSLNILNMLPDKDMAHASAICRHWKALSEDETMWKAKCKELGINELMPPNLCRKICWEMSPWNIQPFNNANYPTALQPFANVITPKCSPSSTDPKTCYERCRWKAIYLRQQKILNNWRGGYSNARCQLRSHDDHVITCLQMRGDTVATGSDDNTIGVWSMTTGECSHQLRGHTGGVWTLQLSEDGAFIISGSTDRTLRVWCTATGNVVHVLNGHTSTVRCTAVRGNMVVSGSRDCTVRLWDFQAGLQLRVFMGHRAAIRCVKFDGRRIVSGGYDNVIIIWDALTGERVHVLEGHTNRVYSLLFNSERNLVISGSLDTNIKVWDVETGKCLQTLTGHHSLTSGMHLLDNRLISCNADSTIKIWDITTGQCLHTLGGRHASAVTSLQYIGHGLLATSSDDGTVKLWDVDNATYVTDLVRLTSAGSGGCVWRLKTNDTTLVCAVGSRNGTEDTKLVFLDYDAPYP